MSELFTINKISLVSTWSYNLEKNKECSICRENLNCSSLEYSEKGLKSYIIKGICGHCFHRECIEKWTSKYSKKCPICHEVWKNLTK